MPKIFVEFVESQPWKHQNRSRFKLSELLDEEVVKTNYDRYTLKIGAGKFLSQFNCDLPAVFAVEFVLKFLRFRSGQCPEILKYRPIFRFEELKKRRGFVHADSLASRTITAVLDRNITSIFMSAYCRHHCRHHRSGRSGPGMTHNLGPGISFHGGVFFFGAFFVITLPKRVPRT